MSCSRPTRKTPDLARRFGGIARLYGEPALRAYQQSRICVAGVGGVGSWVVDRLLARTRRHLRREYGFVKSGPMGATCVYSPEQSRYPRLDGGIGTVRTTPLAASLHCGGLGSATHLTGSFGFIAAARVLEDLAQRAVQGAASPSIDAS